MAPWPPSRMRPQYRYLPHFRQYRYLPSSWDWIAAKHAAMLPPPLDSAALRTTDLSEPSDSQFALEDTRSPRLAPLPPPPASSGFYSATKPSPNVKPPPPIRAESLSAPLKSARPPRPSHSYRKSSWAGERKPTADGKWRWKGQKY